MTVISYQLEVSFITKQHTGLAGESPNYTTSHFSERGGAGSGGEPIPNSLHDTSVAWSKALGPPGWLGFRQNSCVLPLGNPPGWFAAISRFAGTVRAAAQEGEGCCLACSLAQAPLPSRGGLNPYAAAASSVSPSELTGTGSSSSPPPSPLGWLWHFQIPMVS